MLYVDCDTLILSDLSEILSIDLGEYPVGAVIDSVSGYWAKQIEVEEYYNAGVMLFNVKKWKESGFMERMIDHLIKNVHNYPDNDQRLLNDYFRGNIYRLPMRFNVQGTHWAYNEKQYMGAYGEYSYYDVEEIETAKQSPVVMHFFRFLGDYPWEFGNLHPCRREYEKWKKMSP